MDSLHKGGGFKAIYMRKGAIEKKLEKIFIFNLSITGPYMC